jgi:hypothetical protein
MDDCEHFWVNISSKRQRAWQCSHCGELRLDDPAQKREWQGLTDEEIMEMLDYGQYGRVPAYARNFVDAIEAKLKEKNA